MFLTAQILLNLLIIFNIFNGVANSSPNLQPIDYFDVDTIKQLKTLDKPSEEWNMEYNYGRNYKHSKGQEWGNGYNNQYNTGNILRNHQYEGAKKQRAKLLQTEITPIWASTNIDESKMYRGGASEMNDKQQGSMQQSNTLEKQFQKKTGSKMKNWYNWPSKNLTWPNWILKKNPYEMQLVPWWNTNDQQAQKAQSVPRFMPDEIILKQKKFFWPGSIGWTGDLGPFREVPIPPWYD
ncbi:unnamed protein product [Cercopithifilaria johnstoni]|uniref:Uncharacterized protein n=1 Tax=Cercopithifilaria johnstoni TaxID=2874296 RepID=A0A8J2Q2N6_9BILA|nr:unnamed protein product [Cercopithifilaria johnstoni]